MFKFCGKRPVDLGVTGGKFKAAPSWKPNWVSTQADPADAHYIEPIKVSGESKAVIAKLAKVVGNMDRVKILDQGSAYLYAEFSTPLMGYVDDVEFHADGKQLHARSSSRLGVRDFNVNRKRIEAIRKALGA